MFCKVNSVIMILYVVDGHFIIAYISHARACDRNVCSLRSLLYIVCIKIASGKRGIYDRGFSILVIVSHIPYTW